MTILNGHMWVFSTGRGPMNYSGSSITLNSWPHADLIFALELSLLSEPMFGALRRDVLFLASSLGQSDIIRLNAHTEFARWL